MSRPFASGTCGFNSRGYGNTYAIFFSVRSTLLPQSHNCLSASRLVIPYASWIFAASCSRWPAIWWSSSSLSLAQFSLAEAINCSHLVFDLFPIHLYLLSELLLLIRLLSARRHSALGALLDRLNLTSILNVAGVRGYGHIRNAEEVFLEYVAHFEAVEMLQPSLSQ